MDNKLIIDEDYKNFIKEIKEKLYKAQLKAAVLVNTELLKFYWDLGYSILCKQETTVWGDGFLNQLSKDLSNEFSEMKGFSKRNLELIRQWYKFWNQNLIAKQPVSQFQNKVLENKEIFNIPWGQNIIIISKCKNLEEALYYVRNTIKHNWSRTVLVHQIESGLFIREGRTLTNFKEKLPKPQTDLAQQTLKDPYIFDFLRLSKDYTERDLEDGLTEHLSKFLLELGAGFAYIGRQVNIQVGGEDFYIDLLFYHTRLHCYVVLELKTTKFEPEYTGKLNFYIRAVDEQYKQAGDNPTIGLLICKSKNKMVAEYALSDVNKPIGISEYQLTQSLPANLKPSLPSIEELERELAG